MSWDVEMDSFSFEVYHKFLFKYFCSLSQGSTYLQYNTNDGSLFVLYFDI